MKIIRKKRETNENNGTKTKRSVQLCERVAIKTKGTKVDDEKKVRDSTLNGK